MRNRSRFTPLFLLSLALAAGEASAQDKAQNTQEKTPARPQTKAPEKNPYVERFKQLDRNGDGYVTIAEWPLERASFDLVDRDKDGRLSRVELLTPNRLRDEARDEQFHVLDANQDGRLSPTERNGSSLEWLDRNKDGYVSRPEYVDRVEAGQNAWSPRATVRQQHRFQDLDRNRDSRLSRSEWTGVGARFDDIDRNRDGVISPSEWPRR
jgi:Ca2+-binding EF-hand superfamily protein